MSLSAPQIASRKVCDGNEPLVMVTAYDAPGARIAGKAGADIILVGDSVAMVVLGYPGHAESHHRRHGAPHRRGGSGRPGQPHRGRHAVDELSRLM